MTEKRCSKCKEWKLYSEFSKGDNKDGYKSHCKACVKKYSEANKETIAERNKLYYQENRDSILEKNKLYQQKNAVYKAAYNKQYRKVNKDKISEQRKQHYQETREYQLDCKRKYAQENRDYISEYKKGWSKANRDKRRASNARRKALKRTSMTKDFWELDQITLFYGECPEHYHVDHILPLALGGRHELSNLQHLEDFMNLNKGAKHPDDWDDPRPISCRA